MSLKSRIRNLFASENTIRTAFYKARRELKDLGLLFEGSRMDKVTWERSTLSIDGLAGIVGVLGFYYPGEHVIRIPAVCSAALNPYLDGRCMADVLRHEFGHALADLFSKFFHDTRFKTAFGDVYGTIEVAKEGDNKNYVSKYARTYTQEDFAETFMQYVKHKGVLPKEFSRRKAIRAKWETVAAICQDIAKLKK